MTKQLTAIRLAMVITACGAGVAQRVAQESGDAGTWNRAWELLGRKAPRAQFTKTLEMGGQAFEFRSVL